MTNSEGEVLYNGIQLPPQWPPRGEFTNDAKPPNDPFYLELDNIPKVIPVDLGRQLFVDDFLIESMEGLERIYQHPVKYAGNPVVKADTILEMNGGHNATARPNGGGLWWDPKARCYRFWYEAGWLHTIAYMESPNGITFDKEKFGKYKTNEIYPPDIIPDSWEVLPDFQKEDPYSNWLMYLRGPGGDLPGLCLESSNGKHFKNRVLTGSSGDRSNVFWNPFRQKWVFSLRGYRPKDVGRMTCYYETDDFMSGCKWTWNGGYESEDVVEWAKADELDARHPDFNCPTQLYALCAVAYESIMVGAFEIHRGPDNARAANAGMPKITDIVFAYSRDGFHWFRPDRTPAIASEGWESSKWDAGYVQPLGNLFTIQEEKLCFYYGAFAGDPSRLSSYGHLENDNGMYHNGATGLAHLRRDGFAAITGDGTLLTREISFTQGDRLFVNADCSQGEIEVSIIGGEAKTIRSINETKIEVCKASPGTVRISFKISGGAKLYSFWFSNETGKSRGYLGGGGPDYPGIQDV